MRFKVKQIFFILFLFSNSSHIYAEMTIEELFFDDTSPYHLKMLKALPTEAKIQIGSDNAKNTIVEFMDYFCGYCKKIHPELVELAQSRNDVRVIFIQHPILNESSRLLANMVIAANFQKKGYDLHHAIFTIEGSITNEKLKKAIIKSGVNQAKLRIDMSRDEVKKMIKLSSFLAEGSGARGTPSIFINEEFSPGYISKERIEDLLN